MANKYQDFEEKVETLIRRRRPSTFEKRLSTVVLVALILTSVPRMVSSFGLSMGVDLADVGAGSDVGVLIYADVVGAIFFTLLEGAVIYLAFSVFRLLPPKTADKYVTRVSIVAVATLIILVLFITTFQSMYRSFGLTSQSANQAILYGDNVMWLIIVSLFNLAVNGIVVIAAIIVGAHHYYANSFLNEEETEESAAREREQQVTFMRRLKDTYDTMRLNGTEINPHSLSAQANVPIYVAADYLDSLDMLSDEDRDAVPIPVPRNDGRVRQPVILPNSNQKG